MDGQGYDLEEVLQAIEPSRLDYSEWVEIGMALHYEGYSFDVWNNWSKQDTVRYKGNGAMQRKWQGFGQSSNPVKGGTIVSLAKDHGWRPAYRFDGPDIALEWDSPIGGDAPLVDPSWVEAEDLSEPPFWSPIQEAITYLETLFEPGEIVGYVTSAWEKEGRWLPSNKGDYVRTAGQLIEELTKHQSIDAALGTPNIEAGAWIRFNPLDGQGVRNDNVAEYRYALVESDDMEIGKQKAIIEELELPVACLVHSGGKSLHAIVRIEANDYNEYRKRVDYLYSVCKKNGLTIDTQNKNPSRLSRFPGFTRNGTRKQFIVAKEIGKANWDEWYGWIEELNDGLPDIEEFGDWDNISEPPDPIVEDILYPGDKMMIAGKSKAGKSFALIELCCAIAEGSTWLGKQCQQGRVLYVNLELKKEDRKRRFKRVYDGLGLSHENMANIHCLDLRGKSAPLEKLSNSIIRRAVGSRYTAIIIDPIYKVISGDENSAEHVSAFCNQLDKLAETLGCAVIYCHHHSKGGQGQKASMDRASGSGVFARDADALLDMIELDLTESIIAQQQDAAVCAALTEFMDDFGPEGWRDEVPEDEQFMAGLFEGHCQKLLAGDQGAQSTILGLAKMIREEKVTQTAWRIEGTLREFPRFKPINIWFDWPVHRVDELGILEDLQSEGNDLGFRKKKQLSGAELTDAKRQRDKSHKEEIIETIREAMNDCREAGIPPTRANVLEHMGEIDGKQVTLGQLKNWTVKNAKWSPYRIEKIGGVNVLIDTFERDVIAGFEEGMQGGRP